VPFLCRTSLIGEEFDMSEEGSFGLSFTEKLFGFILFVVGLVTTYYTFTSIDALGSFVGFFGFLSIVIVVLGFFLMIAKTEE
jgi:hypothetical protein